MRAITILPYDPVWPAAFARLRDDVAQNLDGVVREIHHVGSTAVPGLAAKPKIDIDAVAISEDALAAAVARTQRRDYVFHGDPYGNGLWCFTRSHGSYGERLYLCAPGNRAHLDRLRFRDHLRAHPGSAAAYAALKHQLAREAAGDWDHYTGGKSAFIAAIVRTASMLPGSDDKQAEGLAESAAEYPT